VTDVTPAEDEGPAAPSVAVTGRFRFGEASRAFALAQPVRMLGRSRHRVNNHARAHLGDSSARIDRPALFAAHAGIMRRGRTEGIVRITDSPYGLGRQGVQRELLGNGMRCCAKYGDVLDPRDAVATDERKRCGKPGRAR
jgi:hypothetical protein